MNHITTKYLIFCSCLSIHCHKKIDQITFQAMYHSRYHSFKILQSKKRKKSKLNYRYVKTKQSQMHVSKLISIPKAATAATDLPFERGIVVCNPPRLYNFQLHCNSTRLIRGPG